MNLRRNVASIALAGLTAPALIFRAQAKPKAAKDVAEVKAGIDRFARLPVASASCLVDAGPLWRLGHDQDTPLFVGSAVKTFILAQYLRGMEAGRLKEDDLCVIDDSVRSFGSPVFGDRRRNGRPDPDLALTGKTQARNVLEAMIAHSDNTATDAALAAAVVEDVRKLIAEAGLKTVKVPTSTRRLFAYLASGKDQDVSWPDLQQLMEKPTNPQPAINLVQSMVASAADMVRWYQAALSGEYFKQPSTLVEFKRIQAMADALVHVVPGNTMASGKGGSLDWNDFHCFSLPGQMMVHARTPVAFCFTVNWAGPEDSVDPTFKSYVSAAADVLAAAARAID